MLDPEMRGWAIVVTNGVRMVGLLRWKNDMERVLEQALEFLPVQRVFNELVPNGKVGEKGQPLMDEVTILRISGWQLAEPLGYPSIGAKGIPVPKHALVIPVSESMSQADMNLLAKGIDSFHAAKRKQENSKLIAGVQ